MRRLLNSPGYLLLSLCWATACGGNVEGGSRDPEGSTPTPEPAASGAEQSSGVDDANADIALGECVLGPSENRATDKPCAWVASGRCYQAREMACNCACPRSRNSQCASGFDGGPDGHVWVACD